MGADQKERPAVILGRGDGIWALTLARAWQVRGVPTVVVSKPTRGDPPADVSVVVPSWQDRIWVARARRLLSPLLRRIQKHLVKAQKEAFAEAGGVGSPARWQYDFVEPFWDSFLLSRTAMRLSPRFVLGQEVHTHGLATIRCRGCSRFIFPWGSDINEVASTSRVMHGLVKHVLQRADLILPTSKTAAAYIHAHYAVSASSIRSLSWGVDLSVFSPASEPEKASIRRSVGLPLGVPVIVNIRRLLPAWNSECVLDALLQAALHHQNTHFVLIAGGRAESEVVSAKEKVLAAKLAERFHFFNELPLHNYAQLLRASDVAVSMNPSFDMRSSSVLQAFACGLTVVSSEHPEYRSMHEDGLTTVFVPKKDPNILSDALNDVLANPSTHCHSREQNLDYIRKNENAEKQMDCLLSLLSDFAAERKSA